MADEQNPQQHPKPDSEMDTQQNPLPNSEMDTEQNPQHHPQPNPEMDTQQNHLPNPEMDTQQNPQLNPEMDTEQNSQQHPQPNPEMDTEQNPLPNPEMDTQQNPQQNPQLRNPQQQLQENPQLDPQQNPQLSPQENRRQAMRRWVQGAHDYLTRFLHASACLNKNCGVVNCAKVKRFIAHRRSCTNNDGTCRPCKYFKTTCRIHGKYCNQNDTICQLTRHLSRKNFAGFLQCYNQKLISPMTLCMRRISSLSQQIGTMMQRLQQIQQAPIA